MARENIKSGLASSYRTEKKEDILPPENLKCRLLFSRGVLLLVRCFSIGIYF